MKHLLILLIIFTVVLAGCPTDTLCEEQFNKCYKFVKDSEQFFIAEGKCNALGGHLTSIGNAFENAIIQNSAESMFDGFTDFWTGGNHLMQNTWTWTDGTPFNFHNWFPGEPSTEQAVSMIISSGQWSSSPASNRLPFVCSLPYSSQTSNCPTCPTVATQTTQQMCTRKLLCEDGWTHFKDYCYKVAYNKTFLLAEETCTKMGAHLASIHSEAENSFVTSLVYYNSFIGLYKMNGKFSWTDNTTLDYTNWAPNQPDNNGGSGAENCVEIIPGSSHSPIWPVASWNDKECSFVQVSIICKKPSLSSNFAK